MFAVVVVTYSAPAATLDATLAAIIDTLDDDIRDIDVRDLDVRDVEFLGDDPNGAGRPAIPVVVVDTGGRASLSGRASTLSTVELLRTANNGYGAAANRGFARARELGATRIVLLNDDVIVRAGWLAALNAELVGDVGAVQPKLLIADTGRINSLGVTLDDAGAGSDIGFDELDEPGSTGQPRDIEIFTGGAVMFSVEFLDSTGGFDERFMLYYEDVDLALRGRELGWRYRLAPGAVVEHIGGLSTSTQPERTRYLQERNRLWNVARHGSSMVAARAVWLSVRRLRHRPYGVHARALAAGVVGMPSRLWQRRITKQRSHRAT